MAQMFNARAILAAEPVAQTLSGVAAGTRIMTMDGEIPVEFLMPGDRIITRDSGVATLRAIAVTVVADAPMIRVTADSLGSGRPGEDVLLAPGQCILLRDWRAKALYGQAQAMVPVSRLVDGQYVSHCTAATARVFALQFDRAHVIYAEGLELASAPALVNAPA
jgi:Hint domain